MNLTGLGILANLPAELHRLTQLRTLILSFNLLKGRIPQSWAEFRSLERLDLRSNKLGGPLPSLAKEDPREISKLRFLDLSGNNFSGPIPVDWKKSRLQEIDLSRNGFIDGSWSFTSGFDELQLLNVNKTRLSVDGFNPWFRYLCTLDDSYTIIMPKGNNVTQHTNPICPSGTRERLIIVVSMAGGFAVIWLGVLLHRLRPKPDAGTIVDFLARFLPLHWVLNVVEYWPTVAVFINVGTDIWVLVQVAPVGSRDVALWPFYVLLAGALLPETIGITVACYTWLAAYRDAKASRFTLLLLTALFLIPFAFWAAAIMFLHSLQGLVHIATCRNTSAHPAAASATDPSEPKLVKSTVDSVTSVTATRVASTPATQAVDPESVIVHTLEAAPSQEPRLPRAGSSRDPITTNSGSRSCCLCMTSFTDVIDPERFATLVAGLMMISEDPISVVVTSIFFVVNKRGLGQIISKYSYALSMAATYGHIILETWRWVGKLKTQGWGAIKDVFDLRYDAQRRQMQRTMHVQRASRTG